ncbi:MAG: hypothetical protein PVG12_08075 [Gammaproteobacteria bacterium]
MTIKKLDGDTYAGIFDAYQLARRINCLDFTPSAGFLPFLDKMVVLFDAG